jgi:hypothetical protein
MSAHLFALWFFLQVGNPAKLPEAALALKALYDADLAEEETSLRTLLIFECLCFIVAGWQPCQAA